MSACGGERFDPQAFGGVVVEGWHASALVEFLASHVVGDLLAVELLDRGVDDVAAGAHDGDALGDRHDLVKLVRDEDERNPLGAEFLDHHEESSDLPLGQGGCWLVHDQQFRVACQGSADCGELLVGDGELFDVGIEGEGDPQAFHDRAGVPGRARAAVEAFLVGHGGGHHDVLGHGEVGEQGEVLVDDLDSGLHRAERRERRDLLALDCDASRVRPVHAGDDLDEG